MYSVFVGSGYTVSMANGTELTSIGTKRITVTYEGKTATLDIGENGIIVNQKQLVRIEITAMPTKTEYIEGESFDPEGMEVTAVYDNGDRIVVEDYTYEPTRALTLEDTVITVRYEGKTATLEIGENEIVVNQKQLVRI